MQETLEVAEMDNDEKELDFKCPHCGHWSEDCEGDYADTMETYEMECDECGGEFKMTVDFTTHYYVNGELQ